MEQGILVNCKIAEDSSKAWSAAPETGEMPMNCKPVPKHGLTPAFPSSSSDEDVRHSSSSSNTTSSSNDDVTTTTTSDDYNVNSDGVVMFSADNHPASHRGATAGRGRKRVVIVGRKARPRTKTMWEWSHYQDRQLKRSASLPTDVAESARRWNQLVEGKPNDRISSSSGKADLDDSMKALFSVLQLNSRQLSDRLRHNTVHKQQFCEDSPASRAADNLDIADLVSNQIQGYSETGSRQSDDVGQNCSSNIVQGCGEGTSQSDVTNLHSDAHSTNPVHTSSKSVDIKQGCKGVANQPGQSVSISGPDTSDKIHNCACGDDIPSSKESSPDKNTASSDTSSSSTPAGEVKGSSTTSAASDQGVSGEKQTVQAGVSCSNEEGKQIRQTGYENNWMHFPWTPQYGKRHYGFQAPPYIFMTNSGMHDNLHSAVGFSGREAKNVFPFYKVDRRRQNQQGKHFGGPYHHNEYGYANFTACGQHGRKYSPRNPRDGSQDFGGVWPHRGRGGLFVRGRGFSRGRGGVFKRGRAADARFSWSPAWGIKSDWNKYGRKGNDWNSCNRDGLDENDGRGYWKARNDSYDWNTQNNELSRGRTPYRTNASQSAYRRHRSAPPAHNMAMADCDFHQSRQRHRSLSRSPHYPAHKTGNWKQYYNHCNFNPQAYAFPRQESGTPQQLYGSNERRCSEELYRRKLHQWNGYQTAQNHQMARNEQPDLDPQPQNNRTRLRQPNFNLASELLASKPEVSNGECSVSVHLDAKKTFPQQAGQNGPQQNGVLVSEPLEQEVIQTTTQNESNLSQSFDKPDTSPQQDGPDTTHQNNGSCTSTQTGEPGIAQQQGQQDVSQQPHGSQQTDGARTKQWEDMILPSTNWLCRSAMSQCKDRPQILKHSKRQYARRQPGGPQLHKAKAVHWQDRQVADNCKGPAMAMFKDSNVTRWQQPLHYRTPQQYDDLTFPPHSDIFKSIQQQTGPRQSLWTAGLPAYPEADDQQADLIWKIMQLQLLQEHQQIDQPEADHILRSLLGMHNPSETSQKLNNLILSSLKGSQALLANGKGNGQESFSAQSCIEQKSRNKPYRSQVGQQRNYHYLNNGTDSYKNTEVPVVQQGNGVNRAEYCTSNVNTNQNGGEFYPTRQGNQSFCVNMPQGKHNQHGNYQRNRRSMAGKENQRRNFNLADQGRQQYSNHKQQQWRKHLKENRTQYVYFLDNQRQTNGNQPPEQDKSQSKTWNYRDMSQLTRFQHANANQLNRSLPVSLQDHGHQFHTILKQTQEQHQQPGAIQTYACQADTLVSVNVQQPPPPIPQQPWSYVTEGMKMKRQVTGNQQNVLDNRPCVNQQNGGQDSSVQTYPFRVVPVPSCQQNGADQVNGNTMILPNMSNAPPPLQFVSNANQPTQTGGNFLQTGQPLPTPMLPTPVNTQLVQHVNTPFVHPLNTPYVQPVSIPYPQQNVFQFPSPIPVVAFGNPGQVGPAPNVFQFPDTTGMQQPVQVATQVQPSQQQVKSPLDKPCGFAGNQPLVLFPPTDYSSFVPSGGQLQQPHIDGNSNNAATPADISVVNNAGVADENGNAIAAT